MRYTTPFLLLCAALHLALAITDGLLPNGNFELGPDPSQLINGTRVAGPFAIPHWEISGSVDYIASGSEQRGALLVVPEGAHAVRLGNEAAVKQRLRVSEGLSYSVTFAAARTCAKNERINVSVTPDSSGVVPIQTIYSSSGWDSYAWAFRAEVDEVELVIHNPGVEDDPACGPLIDSVAIKTLHPPPLTENVLKNGDFEEGPIIFSNTSWGVLIPPNADDVHSPLPSWSVSSTTSKSAKYVDSAHYAVPRGNRAVELVAGNEAALAQVARTAPGTTYAMTFSVGDGGDGCVGGMAVEAFAARGRVRISYESEGKGGFKRAVLRFTAEEERTRVAFASGYYHTKIDGSLCGPIVDDVMLVSVRNPAR